MRKATRATLLVLAGGLLLGCGGARSNGALQLVPNYRPTASLQLRQLSGPLLSTPIQVGTVTDARPEPRDSVGQSLEEGDPIAVKASSENLIEMFRKAIDLNLREAGLDVSDSAEVVLNFQVVRAWVQEDGVYRGEVRLKVTVEKSGVATGEMLVGGTAKRWGATLSPENYEEVISDSLIDAIVHLLNMEELNQAIAVDPAPEGASQEATPVGAT